MWKRMLGFATLSAALATPVAGADALYPVDRDAQRIALTLPDAALDQVQVQYSGAWHREDYARFRSARFEAEIIYAAADPYANAALEVSLPFTRARDSFALNARNRLRTGAIHRLDQPERTLFFQPYTVEATGWACVAVKSEWSHVGRDPRNRPARLMFGYVCDKQGGAIGAERAAALARGIDTRGSRVNWHHDGPALADTVPIGNDRFPFGFGVHFNDHDGDARGG